MLLISLGKHSHRSIRKRFYEALGAIESAEVVSFDVFDTLLIRRVLRPIDVFHRMEAELGSGFEGFSDWRVKAEREARQCAPESFLSEVTLEEIYEVLCRHHAQLEEFKDELSAQEIAIERDMMTAHPLGLALFERARALGLRIVLLSDMYLPEEVVEAMLRKNGYSGDFDLFLSNVYRQSKAHGGLYRTVLDKLGCRPNEVLHIGDNRHADYKMALKMGVHAVHLPKLSETLANPDAVRPLGESILEALSLPRFAEDMLLNGNQEGFWQRVGREVAAPLYLGLISDLIDKIKDAGFTRVCFLSRDGKIMKAVYDILTAGKEGYPRSEYFLASRRATKIASFTKLGKEELQFLIDTGAELSIRDYLDRIHIDPESVEDLVLCSGFFSLDEYPDVVKDRKRLEALFMALEAKILAVAEEEREAYFTYIDSLGLFEEESLAFVDVGWNATIFGAITKLIRMRKPAFPATGFFFGTFERAYLNCDENSSLSGYFVEDCKPAENYKALKHSIAICEVLFSAEEGSFLRFQELEGGVVPEFDAQGATVEHSNSVRQIQEGALVVIREYLRAAGCLQLKIDQGYSTAPFVRMLTKPTVEEAVTWGNLPFWADFGHQVRDRFMARPSTLIRYLVNPYLMKRHYRESYWRAGFYRRLPWVHRFLLRCIYPDLKFAYKAS